jgi:cobalt-zinc-cadmium efflux system membrane fusion protein
MPLRRRSLLLSTLVVVLLTVSGCERPAEPTPPPEPKLEGDSIVFTADAAELQSVRSADIRMQPIPPASLNGRVTWNEDKTVRIFTPFAGRVEKILVQPGQTVARGAALAVIASPDFGQAQADAGRAESDFALAEKNLSRMRELEQNGVAARKDLNAAEAEHARAGAELMRARRRLSMYGGGRGIDYNYTLTSPIAGTVVERNINPGQELRPDQSGPTTPALFVITDPASLWIQLDAAEKDLPLLKPGKRIEVSSAVYPERSFPATLEAVSDFLDPTTHTIKARARADNRERLLKGDMFVRANVDFDGATELLVPTRALYFQSEKHYVFVDEGQGRFTRRTVKVGDVRGNQTEILDGLRDGEKVVTEGALMLQQVLKPRRVQK